MGRVRGPVGDRRRGHFPGAKRYTSRADSSLPCLPGPESWQSHFDGAGATLSSSVTRMLEGAQAESRGGIGILRP